MDVECEARSSEFYLILQTTQSHQAANKPIHPLSRHINYMILNVVAELLLPHIRACME